MKKLTEFKLKDWAGEDSEAQEVLKGLDYGVEIEHGSELVTVTFKLPGYDGNLSFSMEINQGMPTLRAYNDGDDPLVSLVLSPKGAEVVMMQPMMNFDYRESKVCLLSHPEVVESYNRWEVDRERQLVAEKASQDNHLVDGIKKPKL